VEGGGGYELFFQVLKSRAQEDKKLSERRERDRPTLSRSFASTVRVFFFSLSLSLSFVLFLFPPAVTESNVKGDDEEFGAHLILHLL
jgi:hypothetical protein